MRKEKITLQFDCKEEWDDMAPGASGRHCDVCSKEVMDFTSYTDEQLKQFFLQNTSPVCGKYTTRQAGVKRKSFSEYFQGFRLNTIATLTFLTAKLISFDSKAQDSARVAPIDPDNEKLKNQKKLYGDSAIFHIEGYVQRKGQKTRLSNISIEILVNGKKAGVSSTDKDGNINLNIPLANGGESITLIFSRYRYKDVTVSNYVPDGRPLIVKMRKKKKFRLRRRHVVGFYRAW